MKKILTTVLIMISCFIISIPCVSAMIVTYTDLGVPTGIDTSFKTWMNYSAVTNRQSAQYKFIHTWGWCDNQGFMRCSGEKDLGITDDYYLVALGSYYGTAIGTKYRITTSTGQKFYAALGDCKANQHTNSTNQYIPKNGNVVEFIVNSSNLNSNVKRMGNANVMSYLSGKITKIERINFIEP